MPATAASILQVAAPFEPRPLQRNHWALRRNVILLHTCARNLWLRILRVRRSLLILLALKPSRFRSKLLARLHLLRFEHRLSDGASHRRANSALSVLAAVIVRKDNARRETVRRAATLVLASGDVRPKLLNSGAVPGDRACPICVRAFVGVAKQQQTLLLLPQHELTTRVVSLTTCSR